MSKFFLTFAGSVLAAHATMADAEAVNEKAGADAIITTVEELLASSAISVDHMTTLFNAAAKAIDADAKDVKSLGKDRAIAATKLFATLDAAFGSEDAQDAGDLANAVKPEKKKREKREKDGEGRADPFAGKFWVVAPVEPKPRRPPAERGNPARGYNSINIIRANPGISTADYYAKGGRPRDLKKDFEVNKNVLEVVGDEATREAFLKDIAEKTKVEQAAKVEADKAAAAKAEADAKAAVEAKAKKEAEAKDKADKKAVKEAAEKKAAEEKAAAEKAAADKTAA